MAWQKVCNDLCNCPPCIPKSPIQKYNCNCHTHAFPRGAGASCWQKLRWRVLRSSSQDLYVSPYIYYMYLATIYKGNTCRAYARVRLDFLSRTTMRGPRVCIPMSRPRTQGTKDPRQRRLGSDQSWPGQCNPGNRSKHFRTGMRRTPGKQGNYWKTEGNEWQRIASGQELQIP